MLNVKFENDEMELSMTGNVGTILNELAVINAAVLLDITQKAEVPVDEVENTLVNVFLEYMTNALNKATNGNSNSEDDTTDLLN